MMKKSTSHKSLPGGAELRSEKALRGTYSQFLPSRRQRLMSARAAALRLLLGPRTWLPGEATECSAIRRISRPGATGTFTAGKSEQAKGAHDGRHC
jgi:hypothetical protein